MAAKVDVVTTPPTPSEVRRGEMYIRDEGPGLPDAFIVCMKGIVSGSEEYNFEIVAYARQS